MSKAEAGCYKFLIKWGFIAFLAVSVLDYITGGEFSQSLGDEKHRSVDQSETEIPPQNELEVTATNAKSTVTTAEDIKVDIEEPTDSQLQPKYSDVVRRLDEAPVAKKDESFDGSIDEVSKMAEDATVEVSETQDSFNDVPK